MRPSLEQLHNAGEASVSRNRDCEHVNTESELRSSINVHARNTFDQQFDIQMHMGCISIRNMQQITTQTTLGTSKSRIESGVQVKKYSLR